MSSKQQPSGEFDLIYRFFDRPELRSSRSDVVGIGDDCALISVPAGYQLAQSLDTLVEGVHFPENCDPWYLGYRALAVNLSDLAAMGAEAHSFTLGLTLPSADSQWLQKFSDGLAALAQKAGAGLIGGDTTRGPLTLSIQAQGLVAEDKALRRNGAQVGDLIYVSGTLGDAAAALPYVLKGELPESSLNAEQQYLLNRYYMPSPRLALGQWLVANGATAALDISDGLTGDLGHILKASRVGAELDINRLPLSEALMSIAEAGKALELVMAGGDDYELCFTWPNNKPFILPDDLASDCRVTCVGKITSGHQLINAQTGEVLSARAYQHF